MTDIDIRDVMNDEIEKLSEEEELFDLETLILDGVDSKIPIIIDFPTTTGYKKVAAMVKPLTSPQWDSAVKLSRKIRDSTAEIEVLKLGLLDKNGEPFSYDLILKMPNGVVQEIFKKIADVSGVKLTLDGNEEIIDRLMGF